MDKHNPIPKQRKLSRHSQRGSSLLEILISVFIMAIGLLGLALVQVVSLNNINNSQFRSLATAYAYDMAERMRSNRAAVAAGDYDAVTAAETDPNCSPCNFSQIAQLDAYQWNQQIKQAANAGGLPQGEGTVTKNGSLHDIKIVWQEQMHDGSGGKVDTVEFTLSIQL
ncbi:type IV pilus modification protein PilV [Psychromonas aquimarina]|uniref:type IV pilus modification protein PilV n=1 Tax=Psychromonas aquimarina TaxID=444919 RepID=UPI000685721F|nr:type IV pilus modification protein PilV [Psychromonas aquimarina]